MEEKISIFIGKSVVVLFIIAWGALTISAVNAYRNQHELRNDGRETTAVVVEVRERTNRRLGRIYVEYTAGGTVYRNSLPLMRRYAYEGKGVPIYFHESNPNRITVADRSLATDTLGRLMLVPAFMLGIFLFSVIWLTQIAPKRILKKYR